MMKINFGEEFSNKIKNYSNTTMQRISGIMQSLKTEIEAHNLLELIKTSKSEQELVEKLNKENL